MHVLVPLNMIEMLVVVRRHALRGAVVQLVTRWGLCTSHVSLCFTLLEHGFPSSRCDPMRPSPHLSPLVARGEACRSVLCVMELASRYSLRWLALHEANAHSLARKMLCSCNTSTWFPL